MEGKAIIASIWILRLFVILVCLHRVFSTSVKCPRGKILHSQGYGLPDVCVDCHPGTFMPIEGNSYKLCFTCNQYLDPDLEILKSPCNKTHDAEIHCTDGYFRTNHFRPYLTGVCQKCTECLMTSRPCQTFLDALCSIPSEPVLPCRRGEFLHRPKRRCFPCPPNTFMDQHRHTNTFCRKCSVPRTPKEKILRNCTSTHPAIIGCVDGFYRLRRHEARSLADVCIPCRQCQKNKSGTASREVDLSRDKRCCPQPDMEVSQLCPGPNCDDIPATFTVERTAAGDDTSSYGICGEGEYVYFDETIHSLSCQPCPPGTHMDETEHRNRLCQSCAEMFKVKHCLGSAGFVIGSITGVLVAGVVLLAACSILCIIWYKRHRRINEKAAASGSGEFYSIVRDSFIADPLMMNQESSQDLFNTSDIISSGESARVSLVTSESSSQPYHMYEIVD